MDRSEQTAARLLGKEKRRALWPVEVRDRGKFVFSRPHTLHHEGKTYPMEIRSISRRGHEGFWMLIDGRVIHGRTEREAWTNVIRAIDPEVEEVRFA